MLHGGSNGIGAGTVPGDPRQVPIPGPAAVTIHDDGDVAGHVTGIDTGNIHARKLPGGR